MGKDRQRLWAIHATTAPSRRPTDRRQVKGSQPRTFVDTQPIELLCDHPEMDEQRH